MNRCVGFSALLLVLYSVVMICVVARFPKVGSTVAIDGPVITMELATGKDELINLFTVKVKNRDGRDVLRCDTYLDNLYIVIYTAFSLLFLRMMKAKTPDELIPLLQAAIAAALAAGIADGFENYNIFRALALNTGQITDDTAAAIRHPSQVKWVLLFGQYAMMSGLLLRWKEKPFGKSANFALAMFLATASAFGYLGLFFWRPAVQLGGALFGAAPIVSLSLIWPLATWLWHKFLRMLRPETKRELQPGT